MVATATRPPQKRSDLPPDPWGLSQAQVRVMELYAEYGSYKRVARRLNIGTRSIESHVRKVRKKMGIAEQNRVLHVLMFDRWMQETKRKERAKPLFTDR